MNYKKYVKILIKSAWDEMPEKISITDKEEYSATVMQSYSGEYSMQFSIDMFKGIKRFAFPHVVFHELSHVWDFWKHGRLADTVEQRRKDEIYADLCGLELLIDSGIKFPVIRSIISTTIVPMLVYGIRTTLLYFIKWDRSRDIYPHPFIRAWYMWKHGMKYKKRRG